MEILKTENGIENICHSVVYSRNDVYSRDLDDVVLDLYALQPIYVDRNILNLKYTTYPTLVYRIESIPLVKGYNKHDIKAFLEYLKEDDFMIYLSDLRTRAKYNLKNHRLLAIDIGQDLNLNYDENDYNYNDFSVALNLYLYLVSEYILSGSMLSRLVLKGYADGTIYYETYNVYLSRYNSLESYVNRKKLFSNGTKELYEYLYCRNAFTGKIIPGNRL